MNEIIQYFNNLHDIAKIIIGLIFIAIFFSLIKKALKVAILLVILIILVIFAFELPNLLSKLLN